MCTFGFLYLLVAYFLKLGIVRNAQDRPKEHTLIFPDFSCDAIDFFFLRVVPSLSPLTVPGSADFSILERRVGSSSASDVGGVEDERVFGVLIGCASGVMGLDFGGALSCSRSDASELAS